MGAPGHSAADRPMPKQQVSFVLTCGDTLPGYHVRVVGSSSALGCWAPAYGLELETSEGEFPTWRLQEPQPTWRLRERAHGGPSCPAIF